MQTRNLAGIVLSLIVGLAIGAGFVYTIRHQVAGATPIPSPDHDKPTNGGPNDTPIHVQGGSIRFHADGGWKQSPSSNDDYVSAGAPDTSSLVFEDQNTDGKSPHLAQSYMPQPGTSKPWKINIFGADPTGKASSGSGVTVCSSTDNTAGACDDLSGGSQGSYVGIHPFGSGDHINGGGDLHHVRYKRTCPANDPNNNCMNMFEVDVYIGAGSRTSTFNCVQSDGCYLHVGVN